MTFSEIPEAELAAASGFLILITLPLLLLNPLLLVSIVSITGLLGLIIKILIPIILIILRLLALLLALLTLFTLFLGLSRFIISRFVFQSLLLSFQLADRLEELGFVHAGGVTEPRLTFDCLRFVVGS